MFTRILPETLQVGIKLRSLATLACTVFFPFITNCFSNSSDNPHRRGMTPLLRVVGCVRRAWRLMGSKGCRVHAPLPAGGSGPDQHNDTVAWVHKSPHAEPVHLIFCRLCRSHGRQTDKPRTTLPVCSESPHLAVFVRLVGYFLDTLTINHRL